MNIYSWEAIAIIGLISGIVIGMGIGEVIKEYKYDHTIRYEIADQRGFIQIQKYKGNDLLGTRTIPKEVLPKGYETELRLQD